MKRPFDSLTTLLWDGTELHRVEPGEEYLTGVFGPRARKTPSSWTGRYHATIIKGEDVPEYLKAIDKEARSWQEWQSVEPLSHEQAQQVLGDKILVKRILRSRACYRDKSRGCGPIKAKCRIVCLGHADPDLFSLNRQAPTPGRTAEHVAFMMLVAGSNKELLDSGLEWLGWTADAATAFLQGQQPQSERSQPLYMRPPSDGLIAQTPHWKAKLYLIKSNIYGLANAPRLWSIEVTTRLLKLGYIQHSFDKMVFIKRDGNGHLVSIIIVYVDDFLGELTLKLNGRGRYTLSITQKEFITGLETGKIPKGADPDELLNSEQQGELRSVAGCLQWLCGQSRPELSPSVSLNSLNAKSTLANLKSLYFALDFAKETSDYGLLLPDVPLTLATTLVSYSDASWANSPEDLRSQFGVLVFATTPQVTSTPALGTLLEIGEARARVCRSTLAAEAMAADEAVDRLHYTNLYLTEILTGEKAYKTRPRLRMLHVVDAKSLYDSLVQENPQTTEKRLLVNIKSVQDSVDPEAIHWVPTHLMRADGLTKLSAELMQSLSQWLSAPWIILGEAGPLEQFTLHQPLRWKHALCLLTYTSVQVLSLDLLNRALTFDPAKRVTAAQALQHRWFQEAPAPQEPHNMPTWKEHRNETANPRANPGPVPLGVGPGKRPVPLVARSAVFAAAKKMKSCVLGDWRFPIFSQVLGPAARFYRYPVRCVGQHVRLPFGR
eukprot:s4645_g4.t1